MGFVFVLNVKALLCIPKGPAASVSRLNGIRGTSFGDQWALPLPSNQLPGEWRLLELASKTKQPVVGSVVVVVVVVAVVSHWSFLETLYIVF